jgi:hypothetical protein
MRQRLLSVVVLVTALGGVAYADARSDAKAQVEFGIAVAQRGLWKEAIYRWERATQIDPTYAAGFNNLAVAGEVAGKQAAGQRLLIAGSARNGNLARRVEAAVAETEKDIDESAFLGRVQIRFAGDREVELSVVVEVPLRHTEGTGLACAEDE